MKYIRCEDKIMIYAGVDEEWYIKNKGYRFANTIEELCDDFVIYDKSQNNGLPITCPKEKLTEIKPYIQIGMQKHFDCWLKGAVWTDKGLQFVAHMNIDGELELL